MTGLRSSPGADDCSPLADAEAGVNRGRRTPLTLETACARWAELVAKVESGKLCCYDDFNHDLYLSRMVLDRLAHGLSPDGRALIRDSLKELDQRFIEDTIAGTVGNDDWAIRIPPGLSSKARKRWRPLNPPDKGAAL